MVQDEMALNAIEDLLQENPISVEEYVRALNSTVMALARVVNNINETQRELIVRVAALEERMNDSGDRGFDDEFRRFSAMACSPPPAEVATGAQLWEE